MKEIEKEYFKFNYWFNDLSQISAAVTIYKWAILIQIAVFRLHIYIEVGK